MPTVAPVDGNNFCVSCERVFNPKLEGVPVGVLSNNNDGCFVARSAELKVLGVQMSHRRQCLALSNRPLAAHRRFDRGFLGA